MDETEVKPPRPKNAVVILLDSLNRHMLGAYGSREFATPNLDRFAARALRFDRHYSGSLPCMPARHDILCGALDFLWRPWGSIELWEKPLTVDLRRAGVKTMLISDHPHLFESGGENYHTDFHAWDYQRGGESDPWKTRPDPSFVGQPIINTPGREHYQNSRSYFREEDDFPGPRVMRATAQWLDDNAGSKNPPQEGSKNPPQEGSKNPPQEGSKNPPQEGAHDRFFLFVDEFDPHEPFDTPEPYASLYDDSWQGPHLIWPPYAVAAQKRGLINERDAHQVRAQYGGKLTMIDKWFGRVMDALDRNNLWDDTAVFLCTDHGHYLGEKDIWGKPQSPIFNTLGHIPLMVAWPGAAAATTETLTTNVDIHATLADLFGVTPKHRTHGASFLPVLAGEKTQVRDHLLAGIWGREVHLIDADTKYARAPEGPNLPLSMWSNRWSSMPVHHSMPEYEFPTPDERAWLDNMPGTKIPVIRQPFREGDLLPYWAYGRFSGNHLYNLKDDPAEDENRAGEQREAESADRLREALKEIEAPEDQLARLGLA